MRERESERVRGRWREVDVIGGFLKRKDRKDRIRFSICGPECVCVVRMTGMMSVRV